MKYKVHYISAREESTVTIEADSKWEAMARVYENMRRVLTPIVVVSVTEIVEEPA